MLFTLDKGIPGLSAAWVPGLPRPVISTLDDFVALRVKTTPAGARKLYVTQEGCKRIASCGLLVGMPGSQNIPQLNSLIKRVSALGVGVHVGSAYYTKGTRAKTARIDQNADIWRDLTTCVGAFLKIVAPSI